MGVVAEEEHSRELRVEIATDGACSGNPGPGGWGAVMRYGEHEKHISGFQMETTNNRMELMAAIVALETLKRPCRVVVKTDSCYLRDGITKWIHGWKKRNWRKADGKAVENIQLWQDLDMAVQRHQIQWQWVRGHTGDVDNEMADKLARTAIRQGLGKEAPPTSAEK